MKHKAREREGERDVRYRVQGCNAGGCGPWSAAASLVVLLPPATPATPSAAQTGSSKKPTVQVTWSSVATATSYQLEQSGGEAVTQVVYDGAGTSFSQLYATGTYQFRVKACNSAGCSGWSGYATVNVTGDL